MIPAMILRVWTLLKTLIVKNKMRYFFTPALTVFFVSCALVPLVARAELSINPYPIGSQRAAQPAPAGKPMNIRSNPVRTQAASSWVAFKGASAREVLDTWSQEAGVEMIWGAYDDYSVPQTIKMSGSYEKAVEALLNTYGGMYERPVGSLHVGGGQKTLVVTTYEGN